MLLPAYISREAVKRALDSAETARNNQRIDDACQSASRSVDALCRRRFYPELATRYFDWPNTQYAATGRLWLDANEVISLDTLTVGGDLVDPADYLLRRMDDRDEPPYTLIEMNLATGGAFTSGASHQRSIAGVGLFGYRDDTAPTGELTAGVTSSVTAVSVSNGDAAGVGDLLRCGDERMIVTGKDWSDSGQNIGGNLTASAADVLVLVTTGTEYSSGESILVDGETMLIVGIAGNTLIVRRAWDGSPLAAHTTGADIYAARALTCERASLGTTAAAHNDGAALTRQVWPALVAQLALAEALVELQMQGSGYAGKRGSGSGETDPAGGSIEDLRKRVCRAHRRHILGPVAV